MKKLLKSTLVAASVAAACGVQAAEFNELTTTYSKEGTTSVTAITTAPVTLTLEAEYTANDLLTLELSAGGLADSFDAFPSSVTATQGANASITFGKLNAADGKVLYRVTDIQTTPTDGITGAVVNFGAGVKVAGSAVTALAAGQSVKLSSVSKTVNDFTFDSAVEDIAKVESEFADVVVAAVDALDGTIDVTKMRKEFVSGTTDTLVFTHENKDVTGWVNTVTKGQKTFTLNGVFTDLTDADFTSSATSVTVSDTEDKVTFVYPATTTTDTITFTAPGLGSDVVLENQEFTLSGMQAYTTQDSVAGNANVGTDVFAGEWELNGANVNLPYVPYDNVQSPMADRALQQIIYVTNHGSQSGDIFVTATDEAGNVVLDNVAVASVGAKQMVKIAGLISAELATAGFDSGKLSIDITVNAPNDDISVYGAYKHKAEQDRGVIINDQYKGVK